MNITKAGKQTSLTPNTLRYYERIGLIPPVARNKGGTREYTSKDLCWIEFIKTMRSAGLSPETLIEYVALSQLGDTSLEARKDILELQREVLQEKLEFIRKTIRYKIKNKRRQTYEKLYFHVPDDIPAAGGHDLYNWQNERVCRFKKQD